MIKCIIGRQWRVAALSLAIALIAAANAASTARAVSLPPHTPLDMPTINDPDGRPQPRNNPPLADFDCWAWDYAAECSRDVALD